MRQEHEVGRTPADGPERKQMVDVFSKVHPVFGFDDRMFQWRYVDVPGGPLPLVTVKKDERIVGMMAVYPRPLTWDGEKHDAYHMIDVMVLPEYRGQGIFRAISTYFFDHTREVGDVMCGYPNDQSEHGFGTTGWPAHFPVPKHGIDVGEPAGLEHPFVRIEREAIGDWLETLWLSMNKIGVHRDAPYVSWRLSRPNEDYRIYTTADHAAFFVIKPYVDRKVDGSLIVNVCELMVRPDRPELLDQALLFARREAKGLGAKRVTTWAAPTSTNEAAALRGGFRREKTGREATLWAPDEILPIVEPIERWHMAQLDSDVF